MSQVPLRDLIDECLTVVAHRLRDVSVEIDCPPEITVEIIRSQFGQVLMNLIANAADAMLETDSLGEGRIKISAKILENRRFQIIIEDDGPGIPEELRAKIWSLSSLPRG